MTDRKVILTIAMWLGVILCYVCAMIELTTLVSYENWFTAGELFAWVTANKYEVSDIANYCLLYVMPYWFVLTVVLIIALYLIQRSIERQDKKRIRIYVTVEILLLLPFTILPLPSNLVREAGCVRTQIKNINKHRYDAAEYTCCAHKTDSIQANEIHVLAIGESLRYKNLSLNGEYARQTTPSLEQQSNLCLYTDYFANATLTQHAIPMLFTGVTPEHFNNHFSCKGIAAAYTGSGFYTALVSHRAQLMNNGYHNYLAHDFDTLVWVEHDSLIALTVAELAKRKQKLFIVTHYLGNHMFYTNRTDDCLKWRPDYNADRKAKSDSLFVNAYDNSILYTDRLLGEQIKVLETSNAVSTWLFVSDHGEFISKKVSGHGHTYHPTKNEYHVPLMVWYSDEYKTVYPDRVANLLKHKDEAVCADHVFWSVLDMAGIQLSDTLLRDGMSVFGDTLLPHMRTLLLPDGKSVRLLD